jgi:lipoate-protein ligase B
LTGVFASPVQPETPETPGAPSAPEPAPLRKIASIGVGLRGWVSYHGFALNVTLDLAGFETIVPCGLRGVAMTSVRRELGREPGRGGDRAGAACLDASMRRAASAAFRRHFSS